LGKGSPVAPTGKRRVDPARLYDGLRARRRLWPAWADVQSRARTSKSLETREEARRFSEKLLVNLDRISKQLRSGSFEFKPERGVLLKKKGSKKKRPIVAGPIESRIVRRAMLDSLQDIPELRQKLTAGFNYGGVPGKDFGVPGAILKAVTEMRERPYFVRTDIKRFFELVPKEQAIGEILKYTNDSKFSDLFRSAVTTEIEDVEKYGNDIRYFPIFEDGVAQGSCLSPLLCNLLLSEFDVQMNSRGIITIRYIDDLLILGKSASAVFKAFASAQKLLEPMKLACYDPRLPEDRAKAESGLAIKGIEFLGCEIAKGGVRPNGPNRRKLLGRIGQILGDSERTFHSPKTAMNKHFTFSETLRLAGMVIQGWAKTFAFCTDSDLMASLDTEISIQIENYTRRFMSTLAKTDRTDCRRLLGVFPIVDRVQPLKTQLLRSLLSR
jgi:RNA-directed DNA polymerase